MRALPSVLLVGPCLLACPSGPGPQDTDSTGGETSGTDSTGSSTASEPTGSSTGSSTGPGVCGDGQIGGDEACDDDNDEPDDGCAFDCTRSGVALWTYTYDGPTHNLDGPWAVAIDGAGRTILAGYTLVDDGAADGLLIVLDPAGNEVWTHVIAAGRGVENSLLAVAVDDADNIYAAGYMQDVAATVEIHAFDPGGAPLWSFSEAAPPGGASIDAIEFHAGALWSAGFEAMDFTVRELVARRHQLADGAIVWASKTSGGKQYARATGLAFSGPNVVVSGEANDENQDTHPLLATFDDAGGTLSVVLETHNGTWYDAAAIGPDGDVVLIGDRNFGTNQAELLLRRIDAAGAEVWTQAVAPTEGEYHVGVSVAVSGDKVAVAGFFDTVMQQRDMYAARFDGAGNLVWKSSYDNAEAHLFDSAVGAAIGPDRVVIAGSEETLTQSTNLWARAYLPD